MGFLLFLVVILFLLAVTDLIVGVSNDAVNFLNSAIGSKVAKFKTIIIIAAAGVIIGSVFSSGIMEIARTGIFHPQYFTFDKLMWIFLSVMLTDIVLLDIFNTLGLPTSTTVSIVFELLGAAMVTGIIVSFENKAPVNEMMKYINAESVLTIISGIFLSIIIAFTAGIIIQYLCRLVFSFNYEDKLNRYGAPFAGIGITSIIYFLLIKGLKGTTLLNEPTNEWISSHTLVILGILFIAGTLLAKIFQVKVRLNPLKLVVLMGTFSLAMAFAGNDLVNFIGVPITGFLAFENWHASGIPADQLYQDYLASNNVIVPNYMLLIAGIIMALTLWLSAKAKKVTETEVSLGSQQEGEEKFQPNAVSRSIVKSSLLLGNLFSAILPKSMFKYYDLSFEKSKIRQATVVQDKPAFDLLRASANLVIASILIAAATSLKLPLSTTYVSFMVAMGTSLADKAWGRETAVYRVAGVLSVIGGWFITAIIAFSVAGLMALILNKGGIIATIIMLAVVAFYIIFSHIKFYRKEKKAKEKSGKLNLLEPEDADIFESNKKRVTENLKELNHEYGQVLLALKNNDIAVLETTHKKLKELEEFGFKLRAQSIRYIKSLKTDDIKSAQILLYSSDLIQDLTDSIVNMSEECIHYMRNLHRRPDNDFIKVVEELRFKMDSFFSIIRDYLRNNNFEQIDYIKIARDDVRTFINTQLDKQIGIIQVKKTGTKQAILETNILLQSRDILAVSLRILKMFRKYLQ
ncbi:MAG: inorganic phosphate transporter [Terrimonas sp.]|nr:inorganic phosphate transporter [Terrimonas sp.]